MLIGRQNGGSNRCPLFLLKEGFNERAYTKAMVKNSGAAKRKVGSLSPSQHDERDFVFKSVARAWKSSRKADLGLVPLFSTKKLRICVVKAGNILNAYYQH